MDRRQFLKGCAAAAVGLGISKQLTAGPKGLFSSKSISVKLESITSDKPNVILCMTDDMGWGDTGYNGHTHLKTPNLDDMSQSGIRFDRWYTGAPVCSPTRGSCITGRHPFRYGIFTANKGHMKSREITLAEALKTVGYTTGHFGKWHMGTLTTTVNDSNRGGPGSENHYAPPWDNGFDTCFSTEAKVPTWDPMYKEGTTNFYGTRYWTAPGSSVPIHDASLQGDDSRVIMDRAIPFIRDAAAQNKPFLAVVWFHTPHSPVIAGASYRAMYSDQSSNKQHYYGCVTAMDEQVGRLRAELKSLGIADNTMLWFSSDNGPESSSIHSRSQGETGGFRERKRSLYEGGVRVPGLLEWPARIKTSRIVDIPCSTLDYFPTVLDILGFQMPDQPEPVDGVSLKTLIEGSMTQRPMPICFQHGSKRSINDNRYKLISTNDGGSYELYDIIDDPYENSNIASQHQSIVNSMKSQLETWIISCAHSNNGADY